jgi:arylsulfatase A-like enzyme
MATVANIVGRKPHKNWIGESLVPVLFDGKPVQKEVAFSLFYTPEAVKRGQDGFSKIGVRTRDLYYWEDRNKDTRILIDWRKDPGEEHDLAGERPEDFEVYRYLAAQKLDWLRKRERGLKKK